MARIPAKSAPVSDSDRLDASALKAAPSSNDDGMAQEYAKPKRTIKMANGGPVSGGGGKIKSPRTRNANHRGRA